MTTEQLNKPFSITSVCREDILSEKYPKKFVESLDDADMDCIARKIGDNIMESYWIALGVLCDDLMKERGFKKL